VKAELQKMIEDTGEHRLSQQKRRNWYQLPERPQGPAVLCSVLVHTGKTAPGSNALPQVISKTQQAFLTAFEDEGKVCQMSCFMLVSDVSLLPG